MTKRTHAARPIEEVKAADAFVQTLVPRLDAHNPYPLWHGWAIMDGFFAGIDYARKQRDVEHGENAMGGDK